jgi:DNA-binding phage protein
VTYDVALDVIREAALQRYAASAAEGPVPEVVAAELGMSRDTLDRFVKGGRKVEFPTFARILRGLGLDFGQVATRVTSAA